MEYHNDATEVRMTTMECIMYIIKKFSEEDLCWLEQQVRHRAKSKANRTYAVGKRKVHNGSMHAAKATDNNDIQFLIAAQRVYTCTKSEKVSPQGAAQEAYTRLLSRHQGQYIITVPDKNMVIVRVGNSRSENEPERELCHITERLVVGK